MLPWITLEEICFLAYYQQIKKPQVSIKIRRKNNLNSNYTNTGAEAVVDRGRCRKRTISLKIFSKSSQESSMEARIKYPIRFMYLPKMS